jgi:transcriptional regulator with XRE-family HTH domain
MNNTLDIKEIRKKRGVNQTQLAKLVGVNQERISHIERHPLLVSYGQVEKILSALGCEMVLTMKKEWESPINDTKKLSYVYILTHSRLPVFKIGKANDVEIRSQSFDIDLENPHRLMYNNETEAFKAEKTLHAVFQKWRISQDDAIINFGLPKGGSTEWFKIDCRERVYDFIKDNRDILNSEIEPAVYCPRVALP